MGIVGEKITRLIFILTVFSCLVGCGREAQVEEACSRFDPTGLTDVDSVSATLRGDAIALVARSSSDSTMVYSFIDNNDYFIIDRLFVANGSFVIQTASYMISNSADDFDYSCESGGDSLFIKMIR